MLRPSRLWTVLLALAFVFVLVGFAQQSADETVTCPVSGKVMKKAEAKISWEYKGKTYYFRCENCKAKFMKDPESYLQKAQAPTESKAAYTCPMCKDVKSDKPGQCPHCGMDLVKLEPGQLHAHAGMMFHREQMMHHRMMMGPKMGFMKMAGGCMMMGGCPLMGQDVEFKVENTKDGVAVTLTSKNPETVKMIQEHAAKVKAACEKECCSTEAEKK